jgi:hypothetical protein
MRPDTSIATSLEELRALHLQRMEDERVRVERARLVILEATRASAAAAQATVAARVRRQLDQWHAAQAARKRQEGLHQDACVGTALGCEK